VRLILPTPVLGKVEASPFPAPIEPYDPSLKIYQKKFSNYLPWHAHITCLTVAPSARRLGHATKLSEALEQVGDEQDAWFVDLFVRVENEAAIKLYEKMGCVLRPSMCLNSFYLISGVQSAVPQRTTVATQSPTCLTLMLT